MTLTPAYGRDYKSKKAVLVDWDDNKDFIIADFMHPDSGRYVNKEDLHVGEHRGPVNIRYAKLTKVMVVQVK